MDLLKKIEVQIFLLLFCSVFVFVNGHNIQSLHKVPGCETNQKGPMGQLPKQLCGRSANRMPVHTDHPAFVSFLSSLSSRKKKLILMISAPASNRKQ